MKFFITLFVSFLSLLSIAQEEIIVLVDENGLENNIDTLAIVSDADFQYFLIQLKKSNLQRGFFQFSIDSIQRLKSKRVVYCYKGVKYYPGNLQFISSSEDSNVFFKNYELQSIENFNNLEGYLDPLVNNGYPFAELIISHLEVKDSICNLIIDVMPNQLVRIDSIIVKSEEVIEERLLGQLFNINKGDVYSEERISNIDRVIRNSRYYSLLKSTEVLFTNDGAQIYLYLKRKSSNLFDGILGVQQNKDGNRINLNGSLNFMLQNNFQRGESLAFDWKKMPSQTQELSIQMAYPYIGFSDFGVKGDLSIYKQDTSFVSTMKKAGLSYRISVLEELMLFFDSRISFDQKRINSESGKSLIYKAVGVSYWKNNFDSQLNPKKGFYFLTSYSVGNKDVDDGELKTEIQHRSEIVFRKAIPIYNGVNILFEVQEKFQSEGSQLENELIRFGGSEILRGFDELSIRATSMVATSINLRYFLDQNTSIQLFYDQAWYEKNGKDEYVSDFPFGVGVGFSFLAKSGIFSFNYALGSQFNNPLDFRNGKIHFALMSLF